MGAETSGPMGRAMAVVIVGGGAVYGAGRKPPQACVQHVSRHAALENRTYNRLSYRNIVKAPPNARRRRHGHTTDERASGFDSRSPEDQSAVEHDPGHRPSPDRSAPYSLSVRWSLEHCNCEEREDHLRCHYTCQRPDKQTPDNGMRPVQQ